MCIDSFFNLDNLHKVELSHIKSIADFRRWLLKIDGVDEVPENRLAAGYELAIAEKTGLDFTNTLIW